VSKTGAMRVVLAGAPELGATLRRAEHIELARARTLVEAIAELASPVPGAPSETRVVVGPTLLTEADPDRLRRFADLARELQPAARVLAFSGGVVKSAPTGFDGIVVADERQSEIVEQLRGGGNQPPPLKAATPGRPPAASTAAPAQPPPAVSVPALRDGDTPLVRAVLRGEDVLGPALAVLRERLGDPTVSFVSDAESAFSGSQAPVKWEETTLGFLRAGAAGVQALAPHADWLASWLRLREQQVQLREAAFTDPLTGAWNRRYFDRFLNAALVQAKERKHAVTILLFDIDNFKTYNDRFGHPAGDEILSQTVALLRSVIRPSDRVCRLGGDEFAVIFHDPQGPRERNSRHPESVREIADRFQRQVWGCKFPKLAGAAMGTLTISGGLATYPWDGRTPEELLAKADELLMRSKSEGKNAITYGPGATRERDCGPGTLPDPL